MFLGDALPRYKLYPFNALDHSLLEWSSIVLIKDYDPVAKYEFKQLYEMSTSRILPIELEHGPDSEEFQRFYKLKKDLQDFFK